MVPYKVRCALSLSLFFVSMMSIEYETLGLFIPHPGSKGENGVNGEWGSAPYTKILNSSNSLNKYTIR